MDFHAERLQALRQELKAINCQGMIIPRTDRYQSEYVADCDERLAWISGFTGSAGCAIILPHCAAVFVDGRYWLQAHQEVDTRLFEIILISKKTPQSYVAEHLAESEILAYDPWLHTIADEEKWLKSIQAHQWHALSTNPIDKLWQNRPERPLFPIKDHPLEYAGKSHLEKIKECQNQMVLQSADAFILTSPESICWLLNLRGQDFPHTPLIDAMAIVYKNKPVALYIDPSKVSADIKQQRAEDVTFHLPSVFLDDLDKIRDKKILVDPAATPLAIINLFASHQIIKADTPCSLPKAIKNSTEQAGSIAAHIRDGVALTRFLAWFTALEDSTTTEMAAAAQLEAFRREEKLYQGPSFPTIAGFASNGAIVHYRATLASNKTISGSGLFLIDSGGQYLDGTTDVTRTIAVGEPTSEQKQNFTYVLKGHIALARSYFPQGTTGAQLDILARQYLWQQGLDYDHGTGHGVGSYLSVHEGPQRISKYGTKTPLEVGMILSNEPGFYKSNEYGIRIENLVMVTCVEKEFDHPFLTFKTLTLAPIDLRLIVNELLDDSERNWINAYHQQVCETLLPYLDPDTAGWLMEATQPLY